MTVNSTGGFSTVPSGKKTVFELRGVSLREMNGLGKVVFDAGAYVP